MIISLPYREKVKMKGLPDRISLQRVVNNIGGYNVVHPPGPRAAIDKLLKHASSASTTSTHTHMPSTIAEYLSGYQAKSRPCLSTYRHSSSMTTQHIREQGGWISMLSECRITAADLVAFPYASSMKKYHWRPPGRDSLQHLHALFTLTKAKLAMVKGGAGVRYTSRR